ncbi:MAG TPA: PDZ domain-containing protein [Gemmatimonadales bacterium]|nr:PDZ domain-containing protein [Gemmatimonadales bacterium]
MIRWQWLALAGGMATTLAMPADAQVRIERDGPGEVKVYERTPMRRARLGVKVNLQARASDSIGAYVEAVTPGSAAEKAGIQSGDIITKLDGTSLTVGTAREGSSLPGVKLVELAAKLEPNDTVTVEYRRGKDRKSTKIVAEAGGAMIYGMGPDGPREFSFEFGPEGPMGMERMHRQLDRMKVELDGPRGRRVWIGGPLADLELAPLNPDLGRYFGATEGVLVIDVPKESPLGLKGGDVVLTIDGRTPSSPGHLHRILQSYEGEEPVKFEVLRDKRKTTVTGKLPAREDAMKMRPGSMKLRTHGPRSDRVEFELQQPPTGRVLDVRT